MDCAFHPNVWEICAHDTVHNGPDMCNGVFVLDLDTELFSDEATSTFAAEEILGADSLSHVAV